MIHILDGQNDLILDVITLDKIIDDTHRKSLVDFIETYEFAALVDGSYADYLTDRNRLIIPDDNGDLREFVIVKAEKIRDRGGLFVDVFAQATYLDLSKLNVVRPYNFKGTPSQHIGRALNDTGWQAGIVEVGGNISISEESFTSPYAYLRRIAKEFGGELNYRITHDGNRITGRYVDLLERIGQWRGKEVTLGKDLETIRRVEEQDVVTALLGLGPVREDGSRIEVMVEDEDALQRWGRVDENGKLHHLIEAYEIESERDDMSEAEARQYTRTALDKRISLMVSYETTIVDLADVAGLEHEEMFFGDTIRIKDEGFSPPLYLEARIFEMDRSLKQKAKKDIKLGDYIEYTEEEVNAIWEQLRKEIQDRLARMVIATVISSGGDVFKNGVGSTALTAKTFVAGNESDEDGVTYDYQWIKLDKNGEQVDGFIETGKTITVNANDIDEKATYRVLIAYGLDVVTTSEYTLTHLYDGQDGVEGRPGKDGKSSYTHVRYSQNANGSGMTTNPVNAVYIGIAITESPTAPEDNTAYDWSKIKGDDGVGTPGEDGKTSYVHIKYSNDGGTTFTGNNGENPGDYIGTYTDFTKADSNNVNDYTWAKVKGEKGDKGEDGKDGPQGIPGEKGEDGKTYYTWVKYANTPTSGMSDNPSGKDYIGFAYNKETPTMSTNYNDYTWSLYKGPQGVQGIKGADGQTTYTWVKYADTDTGGGMSDNPEGKLYIGLAFNKTTATESNNASDYSWSLMPQNITVGGRNLLRNSVTEHEKDSSLTSLTYLEITHGLISGEEYTISFDARTTNGSDNFYISTSVIKGNTFQRIFDLVPSTIYKRYSFSFIAREGSEDVVEIMINNRISNNHNNTGCLYIKELKLEKGNVATDWTPAPEDVDASIQAVQTTADGKNSIFRQNTQPATAGRKVGDVWFQTNADNRMHVFNGTSWAQAGFGEQAIVADSITANHIKSLNGLNVNDQFKVDNQGNVEFGGHLQGASGTFGEVMVTDGDFNLKDPVTGVEYSATPRRNLLQDHSFELLIPDPESIDQESIERNYLGVVPNKYIYDNSPWERVRNPKVTVQFAPDSRNALAIFGERAIVVRDANYYRQYVYEGIGAGAQYTLSGFFKRQWNAPGGGIPRFEVWHISGNGTRLTRLINATFTPVKNDYTVERHAATFTVPSNYGIEDSLEIIISGGNENWVHCDGAQMVEGDRPSVYQPEDSVWDITKGNYSVNKKMRSLWTGSRYPTATAGQIIYPEKRLSECNSGWVIKWQAYASGSGISNSDFVYTVIPKTHAYYNEGGGIKIVLGGGIANDVIYKKYIYVFDDRIEGHAGNGTNGNEVRVISGVYEI